MIHRRWNMVAIGPCPDKEWDRSGRHILARHGTQRPLDLQFALLGRQINQLIQPRRFGHIGEQLIKGRHADRLEHGFAVGICVR